MTPATRPPMTMRWMFMARTVAPWAALRHRMCMDRMPVLFVGHGSPMNAIEENQWSRGFRALGSLVPEPKAVLCISAHWYVEGTFVTGEPAPRTIHDFGGFSG